MSAPQPHGARPLPGRAPSASLPPAPAAPPAPPISPDPAYLAAWEECRALRRRFLVEWLGGVPAVAATALALEALEPGLATFTAPAMAILCMGRFALNSFRISSWRCPRCGERYFHGNAYARKCVHCKLPGWAVDASGRRE